MLLTVKELAEELRIKPATLYAWAAQQKIPSLKIYGVVRFESERIKEWLKTFGGSPCATALVLGKQRPEQSVEALIARAKRSVYSPIRGNQTNSEPRRKED